MCGADRTILDWHERRGEAGDQPAVPPRLYGDRPLPIMARRIPDECTVGNDIDLDDLSDRCENDISQAFSPELYFYNGDYVGREPYWVARLVGQKVKIGYLLSYYRDEGSSNYLCSLPGAPSSCHGHNGDSEAIFLIVYYDAAHKHWILDEARYTQHGDHVSYPRGPIYTPRCSSIRANWAPTPGPT